MIRIYVGRSYSLKPGLMNFITFCANSTDLHTVDIFIKGKGKVQGVPLPRHQEEEETDKSKQAKIEQTYEKH